jgi:hypothetical protein
MVKQADRGHSCVMPFQAWRPTARSYSSLALADAAAFAVVPRTGRAREPSADLMARLAEYAAAFETIRARCSYEFDGRMVTFDRKGGPDSVKEMTGRIDARDERIVLTVAKYTEDGRDKTDEAQKKARAKAPDDGSPRDKKHARIPFLAEEQPRYVFEHIEVDGADGARAQIGFIPKVPEDDTIEGSVWVDTQTAFVLSAGFKLSKTPMFMDELHFGVEFGAPSALGPAVSTVVADGTAGVLFFRKRFRVTATLSDFRILP